MSAAQELSRLFAAERAEARSDAAAERGFGDLRDALHAGVPPLAVASGPLKLGAVSLAAKGVALSSAVLVGLTASGLALRPEAPKTAPVSAVATTSAPIAARVTQSAEPPVPASPAVPAVTPSLKPTLSAPPEPEPPPSTFADELRLMKAAKQDLDSGKELLARVWLNEHARLYPHGVFQSEREALSVLIACKSSPVSGRVAAQRYVAQHAKSPLVDRILRACELQASPGATSAPSAAPTANFPEDGDVK